MSDASKLHKIAEQRNEDDRRRKAENTPAEYARLLLQITERAKEGVFYMYVPASLDENLQAMLINNGFNVIRTSSDYRIDW